MLLQESQKYIDNSDVSICFRKFLPQSNWDCVIADDLCSPKKYLLLDLVSEELSVMSTGNEEAKSSNTELKQPLFSAPVRGGMLW